MNQRPSLSKALNILRHLAITHFDKNAIDVLDTYYNLKPTQEFLASWYVVEIVHKTNAILNKVKEI